MRECRRPIPTHDRLRYSEHKLHTQLYHPRGVGPIDVIYPASLVEGLFICIPKFGSRKHIEHLSTTEVKFFCWNPSCWSLRPSPQLFDYRAGERGSSPEFPKVPG